MRDRVCRAIAKVDGEIKASAFPSLPLMWTEWNVPSYDTLNARDNWYVGPALARDISQCNGHVTMMSYWTFDDVFEEGGVKAMPFDGGFGLIAPGRIRKPASYDFALLHQLGNTRLENAAENVLVTRREDGTLVLAVWNLVDMDKLAQGSSLTVHLNFKGVSAKASVSIQRVDERHGNPMTLYKSMGSPRYPTLKQVAELNEESALPVSEKAELKNGELDLLLPVNGMALIEVASMK
jgi:xylan 1,4-beta-xylosidase